MRLFRRASRSQVPDLAQLSGRVDGYALPAGLAAAATAGLLAGLFLRRGGAGSARTVRDVMVEGVLTIDAEATMLEAVQLMREGNVGALPVVEHGRLRGIITDRDLVVRGIAEGADPSMTRVGECATWDIICARADSPIEEAMEVMGECQVGRLPVVDTDNRVIGIVTLSSLALRASTPDEALETAQEVAKRSARAA
ncbi:MAG: CBS domain-containing protein [Candidatus Rokubacteria bacterium]|nr:CBS domain-containing protein [Candidatus Rokubacteria bacterium]